MPPPFRAQRSNPFTLRYRLPYVPTSSPDIMNRTQTATVETTTAPETATSPSVTTSAPATTQSTTSAPVHSEVVLTTKKLVLRSQRNRPTTYPYTRTRSGRQLAGTSEVGLAVTSRRKKRGAKRTLPAIRESGAGGSEEGGTTPDDGDMESEDIPQESESGPSGSGSGGGGGGGGSNDPDDPHGGGGGGGGGGPPNPPGDQDDQDDSSDQEEEWCYDEVPIPTYDRVGDNETKIGEYVPFPSNYARGVMDRHEIYNLIAAPNPLTKDFFTHDITGRPLAVRGNILSVTDKNLIALLCCIGYCSKHDRTSFDDIMVRYTGEVVAPFIPQTLRSDRAAEMVMEATRALLQTGYVWYEVGGAPRITINGAEVGLPVPQAEAARVTTYDQAVAVLFALRGSLSASLKAIPRICPLVFCFSVATLGQVTDDKIDNFTARCRDQLSLTISLTSVRVRDIYQAYGRYITDKTVKNILDVWMQTFPKEAMVMKLVLQQASWAGLTQFMTVAKAMYMFSDFPWKKVDLVAPGQLRAYHDALKEVKDNSFYGFRKTLGIVASRNYRTLAFVAKELLIQLGGGSTLRQYAGWDRNPPGRAVIQDMVVKYVSHKQDVVNQAEDPDVPEYPELLSELAARQDAFASAELEIDG